VGTEEPEFVRAMAEDVERLDPQRLRINVRTVVLAEVAAGAPRAAVVQDHGVVPHRKPLREVQRFERPDLRAEGSVQVHGVSRRKVEAVQASENRAPFSAKNGPTRFTFEPHFTLKGPHGFRLKAEATGGGS
jgi:hypothetical protein